MALIKSHSNYVLKKKHQEIEDGTIWERDITTIGGVNQFSPGQIPIYKSSNFIITIRNDGKISNQYNQSKWKENESGDTWTLETISGMTSEFEDQNDVKIVLKQDYYDFCDFAYYGSLSEMFRASINDILQRFPGELYITDISGNTYTSGMTEDFEKIEWNEYIGNSGYTLVSNPFGIDIHSQKKPLDANPLKYFADDGFKNYQIITNDLDESGETISSWSVKTKSGCTKGDIIAEITINENIAISAYIGDNREIVYLSSGNTGIHIRPDEKKFIAPFYNECDNFEKLILNRKTTPKYKASFSIIKENERGYYREIEDFIFPTSYGDYNIDASSYGFNDYTKRLSEIGEFYDALFTDNLYRSMTHEAIKNFDWTYTREFTVGGEEEYVHGGEKMQKALRVFAREFDEILTYINNIKNINRVTYDERNNIPDYFLIDEVENKGWDVCLVYPYDLEEYIKNDDGTKDYVSASTYDEQQQLDNKDNEKFFIRQFTQNTKKEVRPYSKEWVDEYPEGYFISCCGEEPPCQYKGSVYKFVNASGIGSTYYDQCESGATKIKNRIKTYTDEKSYTYMDANNAFMRRMAINSPYIWRHKGTIEGIEMILGMFGLKSQRWVDRMRMTPNCVNSAITADYEITEYSSFANRIEEKWDAVHQMYRIDWINSTKSIVYDYRSTSNYTKYGAPSSYVSYQGLPVLYRYEYILTDKICKNCGYEGVFYGRCPKCGSRKIQSGKTINNAYISPFSAQSATSSVTEAFKEMDNNNSPVRRRYLYPNFDKGEQLDGNPYFQMDGGWLSKTVQNEGYGRYNFQYDVDDNITYTCYVASGGATESGDVIDNKPIYKETVRNIKRVDTIGDLLSTPINTIKDGSIIYVSNVERDVAIIDNEVYSIKHEYSGTSDNGTVLSYVSLVKNGDYIKIGDSKFFMSTIVVYDKNGEEATYNLEDKESGYEVKAYINESETGNKKFICKANTDGAYTIDSFMILDENATTNYFIIDDSYYSDRLATDESRNGWRRLEETDPEYIRINAITNYYEGNNPHNGNMNYDNGHEYFTYFKRLFKYPIDNDLFDERCYEAFYYDLDNEISNYGFSGLVDSNEMIKQYNPYLISGDSKIHYFGSYYKKSSGTVTPCENVLFYGENENKRNELEFMYKNSISSKISVSNYILKDENMIGGTPYSAKTNADEVTNQILNNKRLSIKFYLHNKWHSNQGQCEIKYLDSIVTNYLTQMIPSTTIVDIQYYCPYDECGYLSVGSTSETWEHNDTTSKDIAITSADCISSISVNSLEHFNVTLGNDKVTVSPKGENTSDSAYVEKVKISYNSDSTSCDKEITLTQKANSCTPSTCVCYKVSQATLKNGTSIGSGDTSAEVEWAYTAITWSTDATCKTTSAETTGTSSHTVTSIEVNNTCSDIVRSGSFTWTDHKVCGSNSECTDTDAVINWSVTQDRGKSETDPECSGCYCSGFTIGSAPSAWNCDETSDKYVPYTANTCISNIAASVDNAHFAVSVDTSNTRISVKPSGSNSTTSNITATVTVSFNAGANTCESKTFQVVHNSGSSCNCNCSDLTVSGITNATSTTVASGGGNSNLASYTASCATIGQVVFSDSWITNIGVSNGHITGTVAANCSSTERSGTLTIPYSAGSSTCTSKTVTIKQSVGGLTIVADKQITCQGGTVTFSVQ